MKWFLGFKEYDKKYHIFVEKGRLDPVYPGAEQPSNWVAIFGVSN